jgi:hypothetical protein
MVLFCLRIFRNIVCIELLINRKWSKYVIKNEIIEKYVKIYEIKFS